MTAPFPLHSNPSLDAARLGSERPAALPWRQANLGGRLPPRLAGCCQLDAAGAMTDNFRGVHEQEVDHSGRAGRRNAAGIARPAATRGRRAAGVPEAARPGRRCRPPQDRARPPRRSCSSTWSRSRSTCSSRAGWLDADPAAAKALLDEMGARRPAGAGRDGGARAADLPAAARGGRPRRGAARGGGERRHPGPRRRHGGRELRRRGRGGGVLLLSRGARARRRRGAATVTVREEEGALVFEVVEDGGSGGRDSTGCATASRRSAASSRSCRSPAAASVSPARSRCRDDAQPLSAR